jgi:predicted dehydrogenase
VRAAFGHAGPHAWAPHAKWFYDPRWSGGGCVIDLGVHIVDVVRYVTADDVAEVGALLRRRAGGVEVDAQLLLRLGGGALATVHASWSARPGPDRQLTIVGDEGTLHLDARTPLTCYAPGADGERVPLPESTSSPLLEFLGAVEHGHTPAVTAADGRAAVAVVEAAYRSAETGRIVTVE